MRLSFIFAALLCLSLPAWASVSLYMDPDAVAERSSLVVEATVVRTASGYDPETKALRTYVSLAVDRVLRGEVESRVLVLREHGGRYGSLVHDVDAVPTYRVGERVLVFLEAAADGALRTSGMFFGKFTLHESDDWVRDLDGRGRIHGRPAGSRERFSHSDLVAAALRPSRDATWRIQPEELPRLLWDQVDGASPLESMGDGAVAWPKFAPADTSHPARWEQADAGAAVRFKLQRAGNPLGDGPAAVAEIERALQAWTAVPESRLALELGDDDYNYVGTHTQSPAGSYVGQNAILFDDPYDDIPQPSGCSGLLAIGGYWRSATPGAVVNGVTFYPAVQGYVIFNDGFDCFLSDPDNLAEVATHELGHALGFGHSPTWDAIMRSSAYGNRGPRLGNDDRDALHCVYPHVLSLYSPNGGETLQSGELVPVLWSSSPEAGPDPGVVEIEYSRDGGESWISIASGQSNDGYYAWYVPHEPGTGLLLRVARPILVGDNAGTLPSTCSETRSAPFAIAAPPRVAGAVPDGSSGPPLTVETAGKGRLRLDWGTSCSADAGDYAVYEGRLADLRAGQWKPEPIACSTDGALSADIAPGAGGRYYLVAPLAGPVQGDLGSASGGPRPAPTSACGEIEVSATCSRNRSN
jgi:hypothetical protein